MFRSDLNNVQLPYTYKVIREDSSWTNDKPIKIQVFMLSLGDVVSKN